MRKQLQYIAAGIVILTLSGCSLFGGSDEPSATSSESISTQDEVPFAHETLGEGTVISGGSNAPFVDIIIFPETVPIVSTFTANETAAAWENFDRRERQGRRSPLGFDFQVNETLNVVEKVVGTFPEAQVFTVDEAAVFLNDWAPLFGEGFHADAQNIVRKNANTFVFTPVINSISVPASQIILNTLEDGTVFGWESSYDYRINGVSTIPSLGVEEARNLVRANSSLSPDIVDLVIALRGEQRPVLAWHISDSFAGNDADAYRLVIANGANVGDFVS